MNGGYSIMTRHSDGFSVIELMTALAVIALLAAMAAPTMRSIIENGKIRSAGTSIQNGLSLARAEAVRLNTQVEFEFTDNGWEVRRVASGEVLHQSAGMEVSSGGLSVEAGGNRVTYNAFGRAATLNPDNTDAITRVEIRATNPSGSSNYKPLDIEVQAGGTARLCDPTADVNQPRACLWNN